MRKSLLLIATFICCSLFANAQWTTVVNDTMYSKVLKAERGYTIVLPASYKTNPDKHYPILYMLHGMGDRHWVWNNWGKSSEILNLLVPNGESTEMIVVTPDAGGGDPQIYQNGYFDMPGWEYEKFFFTEFMPYIEKEYRVIGDKQHRAIAGLSMGGGGCTRYAQKHPELFCAVYAMSALMRLPDGRQFDSDPDNKYSKVMRSVIENDCVAHVREADDTRKKELRSIAWYVDCGDDDFLFDYNIEFYQAMRDAKIPCQLRVRDGGHVWEYWRNSLYNLFPFMSRTFGK